MEIKKVDGFITIMNQKTKVQEDEREPINTSKSYFLGLTYLKQANGWNTKNCQGIWNFCNRSTLQEILLNQSISVAFDGNNTDVEVECMGTMTSYTLCGDQRLNFISDETLKQDYPNLEIENIAIYGVKVGNKNPATYFMPREERDELLENHFMNEQNQPIKVIHRQL